MTGIFILHNSSGYNGCRAVTNHQTWINYLYECYNPHVRNEEIQLHLEESASKVRTKACKGIIIGHRLPGSKIWDNTGIAKIDSNEKIAGSYIFRHNAFKKIIHDYTNTRFIIKRLPVNTKLQRSKEDAKGAAEFHLCKTEEWNEKDNNIHMQGYYKFENAGGFYPPDKDDRWPNDSHPNLAFVAMVAPIFSQIIIDTVKSGS